MYIEWLICYPTIANIFPLRLSNVEFLDCFHLGLGDSYLSLIHLRASETASTSSWLICRSVWSLARTSSRTHSCINDAEIDETARFQYIYWARVDNSSRSVILYCMSVLRYLQPTWSFVFDMSLLVKVPKTSSSIGRFAKAFIFKSKAVLGNNEITGTDKQQTGVLMVG